MARVRGVYASIGGGVKSHFSHSFTAGPGDCHCMLAGESMISSNMTISAFYRTQKLRFNVPQTYFVFNYKIKLAYLLPFANIFAYSNGTMSPSHHFHPLTIVLFT